MLLYFKEYTEENTQKQETAKKYLTGKTNEAIDELLRIFYDSDIKILRMNSTSYEFYWGLGSLEVIDRQKMSDIPDKFHKNMQTILPAYPISTETSTADLNKTLSSLEALINDANFIYTII